jgi:hypothetical protein
MKRNADELLRRDLYVVLEQNLLNETLPLSFADASDGDSAAQWRLHHGEQAVLGGPGTELSKLLKRFGIEPTPTCQCRAKAAQMDAWGVDECSRPERVEEVVAVMRAEAEARGLPFLDVVGRLLVRRAIRNARRAASNAGNTAS